MTQGDRKSGDDLFPSRIGEGQKPITTRHYARLTDSWSASVRLAARLYGIHSLRRTKVDLICRRIGNLRAVQMLLGHTKIESTVRYLAVELGDALAISEGIDLRRSRSSEGGISRPRPDADREYRAVA